MRKIQLDGKTWSIEINKKGEYEKVESTFCSNRINNQKYSLVSFIPKALFNEFKYFYNFFFLMITVSQFYQPLKVGFTFTYVAPLATILMVSLGKEAYDDCKRRETDKKDNTTKYKKLMDDMSL
jgi:phospholipid-translocating ATPase